jgi:hypothetical protein
MRAASAITLVLSPEAAYLKWTLAALHAPFNDGPLLVRIRVNGADTRGRAASRDQRREDQPKTASTGFIVPLQYVRSQISGITGCNCKPIGIVL